MDKAGAPGLPLNSQAGRHATGRWRGHGQQTSVGKLGILFSHIFTYWQIGVPKNWDRKRLLYMAEMMNKQQNKHSKVLFTESFLRSWDSKKPALGSPRAMGALRPHGVLLRDWTTWWVGFQHRHLVQLGFKGVSKTRFPKSEALFQLVSAWFNDTRGLEHAGQIWTLNFTEPLHGAWCVWSHKIDKHVHKYVSWSAWQICLDTTYLHAHSNDCTG